MSSKKKQIQFLAIRLPNVKSIGNCHYWLGNREVGLLNSFFFFQDFFNVFI